MKYLVLLCLAFALNVCNGQVVSKVGDVTQYSLSIRKIDTVKTKQFDIPVYRYNKEYLKVITHVNGIKRPDTIITDTLNAIRLLIKEVHKLRYELSLPSSFGFRNASDKAKFTKSRRIN